MSSFNFEDFKKELTPETLQKLQAEDLLDPDALVDLEPSEIDELKLTIGQAKKVRRAVQSLKQLTARRGDELILKHELEKEELKLKAELAKEELKIKGEVADLVLKHNKEVQRMSLEHHSEKLRIQNEVINNSSVSTSETTENGRSKTSLGCGWLYEREKDADKSTTTTDTRGLTSVPKDKICDVKENHDLAEKFRISPEKVFSQKMLTHQPQ